MQRTSWPMPKVRKGLRALGVSRKCRLMSPLSPFVPTVNAAHICSYTVSPFAVETLSSAEKSRDCAYNGPSGRSKRKLCFKSLSCEL